MGEVGLWELLQYRKEDELTNKENALKLKVLMIWQKCSESENNIEDGLKKILASDISIESCPPFLSFDLIVQIMLTDSLWLCKSIFSIFLGSKRQVVQRQT